MIQRKQRSVRIAGAFAAAALTALVMPAGTALGAPSSSPIATIKVGYQPNMGPGAILAIGDEQGFFAKQHVKVDAVRFSSGQPLLSALSAGQIDIGYIGPGAAFNAMKGAATILTLDNLSISDVVLARADSGISKPADLVGKKVLVPEATSGEMVLRVGLKNAGVDYSKITALASTPDAATAAFVAGKADAIAIWAPFSSQIEKSTKVVHVVSDNPADLNHITSPTMVGLWLANNNFFAKNHDAVAAFLRADLDANQYRFDHLQDVVPSVSKFTDVPAALLTSSIPTLKFLPSSELRKDVTDGTLAGWLKDLNQVMVDMGKMDSVVPVSKYFPQGQITSLYSTSSGAAVQVKKSGGVSVGLVVGIVAAVIVVAGGGFLVKRRLS